MFTSHLSKFLTLIIAILFLITNHCCFCLNLKSLNYSSELSFSQAVATWYGPPGGSGSGGACGFADDVAGPPYNGLISAGNQILFKHGSGCGNCYQVKCTQNSACSGNAITITITDECPGDCNNDHVHFDLSGKAFGSLAKPGQEDALRKAGRINIDYQSVRCHYSAPMTFKIDDGSNPYYLAFAIEFVDGDGDIGVVAISSSNSNGWLTMQQSWGATWKVGLPTGIKGPYSVKVTTVESKTIFTVNNVIPADWSPGKKYHG